MVTASRRETASSLHFRQFAVAWRDLAKFHSHFHVASALVSFYRTILGDFLHYLISPLDMKYSVYSRKGIDISEQKDER